MSSPDPTRISATLQLIGTRTRQPGIGSRLPPRRSLSQQSIASLPRPLLRGLLRSSSEKDAYIDSQRDANHKSNPESNLFALHYFAPFFDFFAAKYKTRPTPKKNTKSDNSTIPFYSPERQNNSVLIVSVSSARARSRIGLKC